MSEPDSRSDFERKRDRQMIELLNELRVALPGVQILFAFLLTVPFAQRFSQITHGLMIIGLVFLAIGAAFLLITDVLFDGARVWIYSVIVWCVILGLWFGRPLIRALRGESSGP